MMLAKKSPRLLVAVLLFAACGPGDSRGTARTSGDDPAKGPGVDQASGADGGLPNNCGQQDFVLQPGLPPEVMIVLDRSYSMTSTFDSGTRWSKVTDAVKQVVASLQGQIGWGLTVFPSDSSCGTSASVDVPVAAMNAPAIAAKISSYTPDGNTPTGAAVKQATASMAARTTPNPKYLLLTSDGEPNCGNPTTVCTCAIGSANAQGQCCAGSICFGNCLPLPSDDGAQQATAAVTAAATAGIHTFVIGVAAGGAADAALNQLADAGKEPHPGATRYYAAGSQADLVTAVQTIAGQIISCSFALSAPPPVDASLVDVNVAGVLVPRDPTHANGWDFGAGDTSIQFYGGACTSLQSSGAAAVQAVYRCPPTL